MGTIVEIPHCEWCKDHRKDAFKCRSCGRWCCHDCHLGYDSSDRCTHMKYVVNSKDNWQKKKS